MLAGLEEIIQKNTDILTVTVTLTLNAVIHFFAQDTLAYDDASLDQVWSPRNQQLIKNSRKSYIFITWALAVILTLKLKTAWHSGSWCCITIPSLVAKCSVDQKIPSRQTFTHILNLCYDTDLERNNPIFAQDAPAYDVVLTNQVWLQTDQQFRTYSRK